MKNFTKLILIFFTQFFYGQWIQQDSGVTVGLRDVFAVTENLVFAVGYNGTILKTANGGTNWISKTSGTTQHLNKVQFANANVGYAVGHGGILLKTINSGENWTVIATATTATIFELAVINENVLYWINNGFLVKSTNGGSSFQATNTIQTVNKIQFLNEDIGFAITSNAFLKTINGGLTWSTILSNHPFISFFCVNENVIMVYAQDQGVFKTTNGGLSFTNTPTGGYNNIAAYSKNENEIWEINKMQLLCACPFPHCIVKRNLANNDVIQDCSYGGEGSFYDFASMFFVNDNVGYMVGYYQYTGQWGPPSSNGRIYKNSIGTMLSSKDILPSEKFKIYPNPASNQINISFNQQHSESFQIEIVDTYGKKIYSEVFQPIQDVKINTSSFAKGIYFLSILNKETRQTQKVIIQ